MPQHSPAQVYVSGALVRLRKLPGFPPTGGGFEDAQYTVSLSPIEWNSILAAFQDFVDRPGEPAPGDVPASPDAPASGGKPKKSLKRNLASDRARVSSQPHEIRHAAKKLGKGGTAKILKAKKSLGAKTKREAVMKKVRKSGK